MKGKIPDRASSDGFLMKAGKLVFLDSAKEKDMPVANWLLWLLLIGGIIYFQHLANFSISIDDEVTGLRVTAKPMIGQGRWGFYLLETYFLDQPVIPFLPYFLFLIIMMASFFIIVKTYDLAASWYRLISFPVFIGHPIYSFALEFNQLAFPLSVGILLISCSVFLLGHGFWHEKGNLIRKILLLFLVSLLLSFSVSIYQSLIFLFFISAISIYFFRPFTTKNFISHFLRVILVSALSVFLYWVILRLFLIFYGLKLDYIQDFIHYQLIMDHPAEVLGKFWSEMIAVFSGDESRYGARLSASKGIIGLSAVLILIQSVKTRDFLKIPLFGLVILIPFLMNLLAGSEMPLRSLVSVPFVLFVFLEYLLAQRLSFLRLLGVLFSGIMFFQILNALSRYNAVNQIRINHDRQMIQQVYEAIVSANPNFNRDSTYVFDFYGYKSIPMPAYFAPVSSTINGSVFQWDNGNPDRVAYFLRLHGYGKFKTLPPKLRQKLKTEYEKMPVWPDRKSVKKKGSVTIIRMGK